MHVKSNSIANDFDNSFCLLTQPEIAKSPTRLVAFGRQEGRRPGFDAANYLAATAGVTVEDKRGKDWPGHPRLAVSLIGAFSLAYGNRRIAIKNKKAQALIAYLILSPSPSETRERLCALLWSESEEHKARASLRQTLHSIREALGEAGFAGFGIGRDVVRLDTSSIEVDVWSVMNGVGPDVHPLLADRKCLPDHLLAGFDEVNPSFRSWLLMQRRVLHEKCARQLEDALGAAGSDLSLIKPIASALLNLDPAHEAACRQLMQSYAASGDFVGALRTYKRLWNVLEEEYDVEPSTETQALVVDIKMKSPFGVGSAAPSMAAERAAAASAADIARRRATETEVCAAPRVVAPRELVVSIDAFDCSGVRSSDAYVILSFRRELIARLIRAREWRVRDGMQGTTNPRADGAAEEYCIAASALQTGDRIQLVVTAREAGSDVCAWSDRYQMTLSGWFEAQGTVVRRIATALNFHLSVGRLARPSDARGGPSHAYDGRFGGRALGQI